MATVAFSVFGVGSYLDITVSTLALTGVVGFTVVFEIATHRLEAKLAGTPYMGMLAKIYKELMIMGVISLGVFLTLELGNVKESSAFYAFEFAHIVVFFAALIFVTQACLMMVLSAQLKDSYERSTKINVDHLLSIYSLHRKSKVFHARWFPLSGLRQVMEFKIVQAFFRTTFALPTSFDFALYMREASDSYILSLVDVEATTWVVLLFACFFNLGRVKLWKAIGLTPIAFTDDDHYSDDHYSDDHHNTDDHHATDDHYTDDHATDDHHRRWLAGVVNDNHGSDGELFFMLSGWALFGFALANYFVSRWSELRLLRKAGCDSTHDYHTRLCVIEKEAMEARRNEERLKREGAQGCHLERLKLQVDQAKGDDDEHGAHGQGKGASPPGEGKLQGKLSKHFQKARLHARAASIVQTLSPNARGIAGYKIAVEEGNGDGKDEEQGITDQGRTSAMEDGRSDAAPDSNRKSESISLSARSTDSCVTVSVEGDWGDGATAGNTATTEMGVEMAGVKAGAATPSATGERLREEDRKVQNSAGSGAGSGRTHEGVLQRDESEQQKVDATPLDIFAAAVSNMAGKLDDGGVKGSGRSRASLSQRSSEDSNNTSKRKRSSSSIQEQARRMSSQARGLVRKFSNTVGATPKMNLKNDISDIYLLSSPTLFHRSLDVLLLFSCTYLALWAVNFMPVANEKEYAFLRHFGIILPAAGAFLFNALSVKTSSLLLAISAMDPEIIGKVIDEQIDLEKLVIRFREHLINELEEQGVGKSGLASVFEEMDVSGRGELNVKELNDVFFKLNFHVSKEKCKKLFKVIDKNRKGAVSYNELFEMVYVDEAAAQEEVALKMRGKLHAIK